MGGVIAAISLPLHEVTLVTLYPRSRHPLNKHKDHVSHLNIARRVLQETIRKECRKSCCSLPFSLAQTHNQMNTVTSRSPLLTISTNRAERGGKHIMHWIFLSSLP